MILSRTYNKMTLLFWSSLWGTEKPFIKNSIYGKVLSNLVSDNIKISTYCATDLDSIPNLLWVEFTFKWRIIERPVHSTLGRQDALGMRLYIQQYIWIFYRSSWVRPHSIFSHIDLALLKNSCSNETFDWDWQTETWVIVKVITYSTPRTLEFKSCPVFPLWPESSIEVWQTDRQTGETGRQKGKHIGGSNTFETSYIISTNINYVYEPKT